MVLLDNGSQAAHRATLIRPAPDLQPVVEHFWIQEHCWIQPGGAAGDWRVVPDAAPHLIVAIDRRSGSGPRCRATLVGPRSTACRVDLSQRQWTIGVRLQIGALPALIDLDADACADRSSPIEDVFPARASRSLELSDQARPDQIVQALSRFIRRVQNPRWSAGTWRGELAAAASMAHLAQAVACPSRTLHGRLRRAIGLRPKLVLRIARLHRALDVIRRSPSIALATVAHAAGYADQAHFTRECRALLGETPREWRARRVADSFKTIEPSAEYG